MTVNQEDLQATRMEKLRKDRLHRRQKTGPLVFFSIASAIANISGMKRLGKIMGSIFVVFLITAGISAVLGYFGTTIVDPLKNTDVSSIKNIMSNANVETNGL